MRRDPLADLRPFRDAIGLPRRGVRSTDGAKRPREDHPGRRPAVARARRPRVRASLLRLRRLRWIARRDPEHRERADLRAASAPAPELWDPEPSPSAERWLLACACGRRVG